MYFFQGALPPYTRPWQGKVPPLPATVVQTVPYPSDEEEHGMVMVAWRGPPAKVGYVCVYIYMYVNAIVESMAESMDLSR